MTIVSLSRQLLQAYIQPLVVLTAWIWIGTAPTFAAAPDLTGLGYLQQPGALLPLGREFRAENGQVTTLDSAIDGKPTILILGYYACPSLCGVIRDGALSAVSRSRLIAGRDYKLVFLSIDATEHPAQAAAARSVDLRDYPSLGAAAAWVFLTGKQPDIDAVESAVGFHARYSVALRQFLHPAGLVVVAPDGRVSSYLLGVGFTPDDVGKALSDAQKGKTKRSENPILLLCFHYDANIGRYSLDVIKSLRVAGVITIVGIGAVIWLARRQERRQSPAM